MRFILDPNVLVSAVVASGVSRRLLDAWRLERRYEVIVCPLLIEELDEVLRRPRFHTVITGGELQVLLPLLRREATLVDDPADVPAVTPDPDDDYLVALARREQVDALVSGDGDLTQMHDLQPPVLSPAEALAFLDAER